MKIPPFARVQWPFLGLLRAVFAIVDHRPPFRQFRLNGAGSSVVAPLGRMIPQSQPRRGELRPRMRNIIGSYRTDRKLVGAASVIRTRDPIITNDVLYRLSYCGIVEG